MLRPVSPSFTPSLPPSRSCSSRPCFTITTTVAPISTLYRSIDCHVEPTFNLQPIWGPYRSGRPSLYFTGSIVVVLAPRHLGRSERAIGQRLDRHYIEKASLIKVSLSVRSLHPLSLAESLMARNNRMAIELIVPGPITYCRLVHTTGVKCISLS